MEVLRRPLRSATRFLRFHGFNGRRRPIRSAASSRPTGPSAAPLIGVMGDADIRAGRRASGTTSACAIPQSAEADIRRGRQVSRGRASERGCSSSWRSALAPPRDRGFIAEVCPRTSTMLSSSPTRASFRPAPSTAAWSRCGSRSRRPRAIAHESTSATTSQSQPRCARSSSPARSPWSAPPRGADRLAASCSATCSPVGSRAPPTRSTAPASRLPACGLPALEEIGDPIDLCVICLPGELVIGAAEEALRSGTRSLCVISAGFAETGAEGVARQEQLLTLVRAHGARLVGPNCLGIPIAAVATQRHLRPARLPAGPDRLLVAVRGARPRAARAGRGARARPLRVRLDRQQGRRLLERPARVLGGRPGHRLVLLYVESFGNPRKFARIARRVAREKPVLAMKSGRSRAGQKAAGSHTAALAGSDTAVDARLSPGRRDSRRHARRPARRRSSALAPAGAPWTSGCGAHERRRARDPLRRRVRDSRASSCRSSARRRVPRSQPHFPPRRRAEPGRHARLGDR